jgi:hypothetical protein
MMPTSAIASCRPLSWWNPVSEAGAGPIRVATDVSLRANTIERQIDDRLGEFFRRVPNWEP